MLEVGFPDDGVPVRRDPSGLGIPRRIASGLQRSRQTGSDGAFGRDPVRRR